MKANVQELRQAVHALKGYSALVADVDKGTFGGRLPKRAFFEVLLGRVVSKADKALVQAYLDAFPEGEEGKSKAYKKRRSYGTKSTAKGSTAKRTTAVGSKRKATTQPKVVVKTQPKVESKPKAYADSDLRSKLKSLLDLHSQGILTDAIAVSGIKALLA